MAKAPIRMTMTPASKARLASIGRAKVMPELRRGLITSTSGAVPAVRAKVRSLPSENKQRTRESLRSQVAMAVKRKVRASFRNVEVAIFVRGHGLANLARCLEGIIPWRHPTYGHKPIVTQQPMPFFYETLDRLMPGVEVRIRRALILFERKI